MKPSSPSSRVPGTLLALAGLATLASAQATITVSNSAQLQSALTTAGPGTIVDVLPGTYTGPFSLLSASDFTVVANGGLGSVFLRGPAGGGSAPILTIATPHTPTMRFENIVFRQNTNVGGNGGGVSIAASSPTFQNCRVSLCRASQGGNGGGLYISGASNPVLRRSFVRDCSATLGGGIFVENMTDPLEVPRPEIRLTRIEDNYAAMGGGGVGIRGSARVLIEDSWVLANSTDQDGGGVWSESGSILEVLESVVGFNTAALNGGGIYINHFEGGVIENSTIYDNACTDPLFSLGGGIWIGTNPAFALGGFGTFEGGYGAGSPGNGGFDSYEFNDDLLTGNAAADGGGIYAQDAAPLSRFLTLSANDAFASVTGGYLVNNSSGLPLVLQDSILWGNLALLPGTTGWDDEFLDIGATASTLDDNDIEGIGMLGTNFSQDPQWLPGYTTTLSPVDGYFLTQPGSPCIDASNANVSSFPFLTGRSTAPSGASDTGLADLGYHYP